MKQLIPVGFYRELTDDPDEQQSLPSMTAALADSPQSSEDRIVAYLRNAICFGARGIFVEDALDPTSAASLLPDLYTDGTYVWRLDIAHYVEKYHLRLPADFISHMASMNWTPPLEEQVDMGSLDI